MFNNIPEATQQQLETPNQQHDLITAEVSVPVFWVLGPISSMFESSLNFAPKSLKVQL